jgi:prophage regulatory protein
LAGKSALIEVEMSGGLSQERGSYPAKAARPDPMKGEEGDRRGLKLPPAPAGTERLFYDRLVRLPEVLRLCALSRSTLYNKIAKGEFPKQVRLGANIVAWYESDVLAWMQSPT